MEKITFEIPQEILKTATKCQKDFSCVRGQMACIDKIKPQAGKATLFVKYEECRSCSYCKPFRRYYVCTCPARNEIYKRYKV